MPVRRGQVLAAACVAAAAVLRLVLDPVLGDSVPFITLFPAVLVASAWAGPAAGVSALALGSVVAGFAWLSPARTLPAGAFPWAPPLAFLFLGGVVVAVAALLRELVDVHAMSEARARVLAHEMEHRVANVLGVVQAISRQTARNAATVAEHQASFEARIAALGRAQRLVTETRGAPPDIASLLRQVLEPFGEDRFALSGPPTAMPGELGTSLALLMHELGTNAVKHGALSAPDGRVAITWASEGERTALEWRELNGPPVAAPSRTGFGSRLLKTAFSPQQGEASIAFDPTGVRCSIRLATAAA